MTEPVDSSRPGEPEVTIGLFGPRRVLRIMHEESERFSAASRIRFVRFAHEQPEGAEARYRRHRDPVDAAVFPGPWWFDLARTEQWLSVPATHLALTGSALYAALLRAVTDPRRTGVDLERVSIDSLAPESVTEAYGEVGVVSDRVRCAPYESPESVTGFVGFHRDAAADGATLALTTILSVQRELAGHGVQVVRIAPTRSTVRRALETAVLLGRGTRLEAHQIAMIGVRLMPTGASAAGASDYWHQELALTTHQLLLAEARVVGATVQRRSDSLFWLTTTQGGLEQLTGRLRSAPFLREVTARLGVPVAVGLGSGDTARGAEVNALTAVEESTALGGQIAVYLDDSDTRLELEPPSEPPRTEQHSEVDQDDRPARLLTAIVSHVGQPPGQQFVADVETVATALRVSNRTGRRVLKELVDAGLAWPLPPVRSAGGGRPRQAFRLRTEKLTETPD